MAPAQALASYLGHPAGAAAAGGLPHEMLAEALEQCVARGRSAWPDVTLDGAVFARHLAERSRAGGAIEAVLPLGHVEDLYLACACRLGDPAALAAFEQRYIARVPSYIAKLRGGDALVDETRQLLRQKLLMGGGGETGPRIAGYAGRGTLESWVCIAALRMALNLLRSPGGRSDAVPVDALDDLLPADDPELELLKRRHRSDFTAALRDAMAQMPPRDRHLLRLHHLERLSLAQIGRAMSVHRVTAARWLDGAHAALLDGTRAVLRARLGLDESDCESLIRLVQSRIDVTMRGLFDDPRR